MSAGQTVVEYGDITFRNCLTKRFEQEAVFDDSGADLLYYKFTVRIVGYVHGRGVLNSVNISPPTVTGSAADQHRNVRPIVLGARNPFEMRMGADANGDGGQILLNCFRVIPSDPTLVGVDVNNGPKGRLFSITHVAGDEVFRVEAEFEICKVECGPDDSGHKNLSRVLNNRWSCVDTIDANFFTTRTWTGRLRLHSSTFNPQTFRAFVVPDLSPGMRRETMDFTATEDGLNLDYTITDKEVNFSAPDPATSWKFSHTEETGPDGMLGFANVDVMLAGDRLVDKTKLISLAASIISAKIIDLDDIPKRFRDDNHRDRILSLSVTNTIGSDQTNVIRAYARVQHLQKHNVRFPLVLQKLGTPISKDDLVIDPNYDPDRSRGGREGDELELSGPVSLVGAWSAYLQTPCDDKHGLDLADAKEPTEETGRKRDVPDIEARILDDPPEDPKPEWMSEEHASSIYTFWEMDSQYVTNQYNAQLPIAASVSGSPGSQLQDSSVIVTLAQPVTYRIVRIKGERLGITPVFPAPSNYTDENGIRGTLLRSNIVPGANERNRDGQELCRATIEYVYALSRAPTAAQKLRVGTNPWDNLGLHETDPALLSGDPA